MIRRPHLACTRRFARQVLALTAVILAAASTPPKSVAQAQSVEGAGERGPTKKPDGQLKEGLGTPASPLPKDEEGASTEVTAHCLSPTQVEDRDGDFKRNRSALSSAEFCIQQDTFTEGGLRWVLQIVYSKKNPHSVLWVVPHDNEDDAFDSAVYGLQQHGGTIVAVETGGSRFNRSQDPNRNFNSGTAKCPEQIAPSPVYTSRVMKWWRERTPIVALHTNERGYAGDGKGGAGGISISKVPDGARAFRTAKSITAKSPDDTLVFVASTEQPENDANLKRFVQTLNQKGINVLYEHVSRTRNDCSLSNYAALNNIRDYINIEVVRTDGPAQRAMIDIVLQTMQPNGIGALAEPAGQGGTPPTAALGVQPSGAAKPKPAGAAQEPARHPAPPASEQVARAPPEKPAGQDLTRQRAMSSRVLARLGSYNYPEKPPEQRDFDIRWEDLTKHFESVRPYRPVVRYSTETRRFEFYVGPFASEDEANTFCDELTAERRKKKHQGGTCEVTKD